MSSENVTEGAINWFTECLQELHELALHFLEEKNKGADSVSMEDYEHLMNWSIERFQELRDDIEQYGNRNFCSKCGTEL